MPITDIGSYVTTMQEFIEHWIDVNVFLSGTPTVELKLKGGYTLVAFTADRATLEADIVFIDTDNTLELAMADRDLKKEAIRTPLSQFRGAVESQLTDTKYEAALPTLPPIGTDETAYLRPFDDIAILWGKINADKTIPVFTPPLLLAGGYTLANFTTELAAMRAAYAAVGAAEENLKLRRAERDKRMKEAVARMRQYRAAVVANLAPDNPLLAMVPDLWPSGSEPQPVTLAAVWNAATSKADLSWNASTDSALGVYSVRTSPRPTYDEATDTVVADLPPGTLILSTDAGLTTPGSTALFRVYVVRTTGAEAGSNVVSVSRP